MICVFQNGEIVERGRHQELIDMDGAYKTLIQRQLTNATGSPSKMMSATPKKEKEQPEEVPKKVQDPVFELKQTVTEVENASDVPEDPAVSELPKE